LIVAKERAAAHSGGSMRIQKFASELTWGVLAVVILSAGFAGNANAQTRNNVTQVQETDDKVKVDLYTRFVDNYKTNRPVAYETAKDYLQRYGKERDQYSEYVQMWTADYEREERRRQLRHLVFDDRNFTEAFKIGKQVMAENPDHLDSLIALTNAGYLAANARNETFNTETLSYAHNAIAQLESGKVPETWDPFKGKNDTLAYLHATVGLMKLKTNPSESIDAILKTESLESDLKKLPTLYYYLARAYETGPYAKLSADYQTRFANKPESAESKLALEKLGQVIDRIVDAYARAVAAAGTEQQYTATKTAWMTPLTSYYKFRHQDSDAGLNDYIAKILSTPVLAKP
jgi:hypothetical protein